MGSEIGKRVLDLLFCFAGTEALHSTSKVQNGVARKYTVVCESDGLF